MIILVIEGAIVAYSTWLLARKYFGTQGFCEFIIASFLLFFSQIVLVGLFLGVIGKFYLENVFLAHLAILIFLLLGLRNKKAAPVSKPEIDFFMNSNLLLLAFAVFTSFFLVKIYVNLINPPLSPDSLAQHLVFPASWIVSGNLDNPFQIFGSIPMLNPSGFETSSGSYYPINGQLFYAWLMLPLRNAFLADAGEAPFYIIGIITIYLILRKYNIEKKLSLLSAFLWALIPNIFKQLRIASEVDVLCAVLLLLVFLTILWLKSDFTFKPAVFFGIALGLLVGTKVINLVWLAAFMPFICYMLYKGMHSSKTPPETKSSLFVTIILLVILFGGFMYIKNLFFTGNPLFPYNLKIFGRTILQGLLDNSEYKRQVANWGFDFNKIIFKEGLGLQFLLLILPGTFIPLFFYRYLKDKVQPLGEYLLIFATPLIMLILYTVSINIFTTRYFYPYLSLGLVASVIFVTKLPHGNRYLQFVAFLSILNATFQLANGYELVIAVLISIALFTSLVIYKIQVAAFYKSKAFGRRLLIGAIPLFLFLTYLNNWYDRNEFERYPTSFSKKESWQRDIGKGYKALNEITGSGARVAYTGRQEFYPFYGTRLKNYVKYVSVNEKDMTPYNKPDGQYRKIKDFAAWRKNLKDEKIDYLFVAQPFLNNRESPDPKAFPIEDDWAVAHPEDFQLLFSNSMSHIYKVVIDK